MHLLRSTFLVFPAKGRALALTMGMVEPKLFFFFFLGLIDGCDDAYALFGGLRSL